MRPLDLAVLALYLAATAWFAIRAGRRRPPGAGGDDEYLLAGRRLTLPSLVVTLVATWYGGVLGVGEYAYTYGISNWLVMGVPYYVGALLFALLFAERARNSESTTVPDLLYGHYGKAAGALGALTVYALSLPAAYLLMLGVIFRRALGIPQGTAVILSAVFCVGYVALRGFAAVVDTKPLQFALMYGAFVILLPVAYMAAGGVAPLRELPATLWSWHGGRGAPYVIGWYFIALQTLVEPTFFQRAFAAGSAARARRAVLWAIVCFAVFDGLTTFSGMYARVLLPGLPSAVDAFPALGEKLLPAPLLGLFYAGLLATVMSTVDAYLFNLGVTFGRDVVWRASDGRLNEITATRVGLGLGAVVSTLIALGAESVVNLWYGFGSVGTAVLLPPLLGTLYPRLAADRRVVPWGMALAGVVTLLWVVVEFGREGGPPLGIEPIYVGLALGFAVHGLGFTIREMGVRRCDDHVRNGGVS